jgi:hypothetical protein
MVTVVLPLPVIVAGVKLHEASGGSPEQEPTEKEMVLLYPGWPVTVSTSVPLAPGVEIVTFELAAANAKSGSSVTVAAELFEDR